MGALTRIAGPSTEPVTLAVAKQQLNVSTTNDETYITGLVKRATRYVENYTGRSIMMQRWKLVLDDFEDPDYVHQDTLSRGGLTRDVIFVPRPPLSSVGTSTGDALVYTNASGVATTLSSTTYDVDSVSEPARIAESYNNTWPTVRSDVVNAVTLLFKAGYSTTDQNEVPEDLQHAILMLTAHWYRNREAAGPEMSRNVEFSVNSLLDSYVVEHYG